MQSTKMKVADVEFELFDSGKGAPLFFLHGGGGFAPDQPFVSRLAGKHRLIAPSHPGFGNSSLPEWLDSVDDIAHLYLEMLDKLGVEQADFVGCSIGGWIAAEMATKVPNRVRRLVMVSPVGVKLGSPDKLDIPDIFALPQADVQKLTYHDPAKMAADPAKMTDEQLSTMFRNRETLALLVWEPWMHNPKLTRRLHRVTAPTLFVRGESDGLVSADYMNAYAKLLPNAKTATIAQAGHAPNLEQPQAFVQTLFEFLGE